MPTPFGPTTPIRLSGATVRETRSRTVRPARSWERSRATSVAAGDGGADGRAGGVRDAGNGNLRDQGTRVGHGATSSQRTDRE